MNIQERLELYKTALKDYQEGLDNFEYDFLLWKNLTRGFCRYFSATHFISLYNNKFKYILPELYIQRKTSEPNPDHYFLIGESLNGLVVRIEALKKAIALCEKEIED